VQHEQVLQRLLNTDRDSTTELNPCMYLYPWLRCGARRIQRHGIVGARLMSREGHFLEGTRNFLYVFKSRTDFCCVDFFC